MVARKKPVITTGLFGDSREENHKLQRTELTRLMKYTFKNLTLEEFCGIFINPVQAVLEYYELSNGAKTCQQMSLLFNPHRMTVKTRNSPMSVYEAFTNPKYATGLARAYLSQRRMRKPNSYIGIMNTALGMNVNNIQYINEFPPHVARDIAKRFGLNKRSTVLDPCAGWGGRMIGFSTVVDRYVGFEPSTETYAGLKKLRTFLHRMNPDFKANIQCLPFEDSMLPSNRFDLALTSPPYYDTEEYTDEETNSLNRYGTFEEWCAGFYEPLIERTMDALKPGGVFVLNIGSRNYPLNDVMRDVCARNGWQVSKLGDYLSGKAGLGKHGEGETFYEIHKTNSR